MSCEARAVCTKTNTNPSNYIDAISMNPKSSLLMSSSQSRVVRRDPRRDLAQFSGPAISDANVAGRNELLLLGEKHAVLIFDNEFFPGHSSYAAVIASGSPHLLMWAPSASVRMM